MSKLLNPAIQQEWSDSDGHWILLRPGYHVDGAHAIVESSKPEATKRLRDVKRCECPDCGALLGGFRA